MIVASWNCRGAGNKTFPATVQEVVRRYDINVLCLLETRVSGCKADEVVRRCGFSNWLRVEASGYTGGIWVLWNDHEMQVNYICSSTQLLHCEICDLRNGEKYLTSFVYGETSRAKRMNLWHSLRTITGHLERAWLVVRDFNTFLKPQDKLGGSPPNYQAMRNFADCVSDTGLMEIPIVGERFTWEKKGVNERLDWASGNLEWELNFSQSKVTHGLKFKSDHRILVINTGTGAPNSRLTTRPFKYNAAWSMEEGFTDIVGKSWNNTDWYNLLSGFLTEKK
ncbi:uncharacterized protein LOC114714269 [Neltuma alba]|uniref:uncharacterized protein LOC114714269 n=1 Tax=Neltuma alba TaxID=207710 RepID=UPI0010A4147D|nr:uncharacterized protein LOC114714269 [Prosopis alba]